METKNIILSKKDALLLEDTIVRYGRIVTFVQLKRACKGAYSSAELKNRVSLLVRLGWLLRLKKGLYAVVTDIGALASGDISFYTISQALNKNSYVSFENALQYHGMFDQMLSGIAAVTFKRARSYKVRDTQIRFFRVKKRLYFGFSRERSDIGLVNIARKEKALLDILYFRSQANYTSLVWEKLNAYRDSLDFGLLKQYAKKFNLGVVRKVGFLLGRLGINTDDLHQMIKGKTSYSRMSAGSKKFDAKWRVYFDAGIIK